MSTAPEPTPLQLAQEIDVALDGLSSTVDNLLTSLGAPEDDTAPADTPAPAMAPATMGNTLRPHPGRRHPYYG